MRSMTGLCRIDVGWVWGGCAVDVGWMWTLCQASVRFGPKRHYATRWPSCWIGAFPYGDLDNSGQDCHPYCDVTTKTARK